MNNKICGVCGSPMVRNGRTSSGSQRWRCLSCGTSQVHSIDTSSRDLAAFVAWLLSKGTQLEMPGEGRSFRRRTAGFWGIWPMPGVVDEVHRVIHVDGIHLASDVVILIASGSEHILRSMLRDEDIELLRRVYAIRPDELGRPAEWGSGLVWSELHTRTPYRE